MPSFIKSLLLVLLGALLASLSWYFWIASDFQQEADLMLAETIQRSTDIQMTSAQSAQLSSYLAMDLIALEADPDEVHCLLREFARVKHQHLLANQNSVPFIAESIVNDFEELEEDPSCSNR